MIKDNYASVIFTVWGFTTRGPGYAHAPKNTGVGGAPNAVIESVISLMTEIGSVRKNKLRNRRVLPASWVSQFRGR